MRIRLRVVFDAGADTASSARSPNRLHHATECVMPKLDGSPWSFWGDESAVTTIEYALLAGVVAAALVAAGGTSENNVLGELATAIRAAVDEAVNADAGG